MEDELAVLEAIFGDELKHKGSSITYCLSVGSKSVSLQFTYNTKREVWNNDVLLIDPTNNINVASFKSKLLACVKEGNASGEPFIYSVIEQMREYLRTRPKVIEVTTAPYVKPKPKAKKRGYQGKKPWSEAQQKRNHQINKSKKKNKNPKPSAPVVYDINMDHKHVKRLYQLLDVEGEPQQQPQQQQTSGAGGVTRLALTAKSSKRVRRRLLSIYNQLVDDYGYTVADVNDVMLNRCLGQSFDDHLEYLIVNNVKPQYNEREAVPGSEKSQQKVDVREYSFGKWTGKNPRTLLHEWCQKHKCSKPQYKKTKGKIFRYSVSVKVLTGKSVPNYAKDEMIHHVCPDGAVDAGQAMHLAAAYFLFCMTASKNRRTG